MAPLRMVVATRMRQGVGREHARQDWCAAPPRTQHLSCWGAVAVSAGGAAALSRAPKNSLCSSWATALRQGCAAAQILHPTPSQGAQSEAVAAGAWRSQTSPRPELIRLSFHCLHAVTPNR